MNWSLMFFINSIMLGVGLAMDAFSVSLANGLNEPSMRKKKMCCVAGVYAFFQALMPMTGWICVHTIIQYFRFFEKFIPWIALFLLLYIGISMILEAKKEEDDKDAASRLGRGTLLVQGIATSIDALSVGFTIAEYPASMAVICSLIIALVTFVICMAGLHLGKQFGTRFAGKASLLGGLILIGIGIEIFIKGVLL
ncbi:MAG: manganese efflux pump [Eubacterium sp.]|nr:manganese efflux pump [Eubacterium sp.]